MKTFGKLGKSIKSISLVAVNVVRNTDTPEGLSRKQLHPVTAHASCSCRQGASVRAVTTFAQTAGQYSWLLLLGVSHRPQTRGQERITTG